MEPELQIGQLTKAIAGHDEVWAVHYACESFYDQLDHPAAISAISVSRVPPGEDQTFSVSDASGEDSELLAIRRFYEWLRNRPDARLVHWNMNKSEYGFSAIANRYLFIAGADAQPAPVHSKDRLHDLDELIKSRHGPEYAAHPRLGVVVALNGIATRYSLTGAEQAEAYRRGAHGDLVRATSERVRCIARLAVLLAEGQLQTQRSGPAVRFAGGIMDSIDVVLAMGERLRDCAAELGNRRADRPGLALTDEYDYQDMLRAMLRMFFDDVVAEDYVPHNAGAASRVDFLLRDFGIGVELKATRESRDPARLAEELIVDAQRYRAHGGIRHLVCLVFDADRLIPNPAGLEKDLTKTTESLPVTVKIVR